MSERKSYPLSWPEGWKRAKLRMSAKFSRREDQKYGAQGQPLYREKKDLSVADSVKRVLGELQRMGIRDWNIIISSNVPLRLDGLPRSDKEPFDPGAAVYWKKKDADAMRCMAIDQYTRVADNLAAIAATLEAMRAIERHGGAQILERAFLGFAALPEKASQSWRASQFQNNDRFFLIPSRGSSWSRSLRSPRSRVNLSALRSHPRRLAGVRGTDRAEPLLPL